MMRTTSNLVKALAVLSALLPLCNSGLAQTPTIVYDNSTTDLNQIHGNNGVEFGDEINLAGSSRTVTDFQFEYFLSANANGNETAVLTFYKNDGTSGAPNTVLYTSPILNLQAGYQHAEASGISINVPDHFTWTVTFQGIDQNEVAGLRLFDPPTVGSSFSDFWEKNNGTWNTALFNNGDTPANFAARVTAVPEPTTIAYGLLAGLGFAGYLGLRRRTS